MSDRTRTVGGVGRPLALLSAVGLLAGAACFMPELPGAPPVDRGLDLRSSSLPGGGQPFAVVTADFNRDGAVDLAISNPAASAISIYLGQGDGSFAQPSDVATGQRPRGLVAADLNADGAVDLATATTGANAVSLHLGLGDGSFGEAEAFAVGSRPFMLEPGDLDGDGHLDLAVANEGEKTDGRGLSVLLGDGRGGFSVASFATGEHGSDVAVADFDRDGAADVALSAWGTNDVNLHLGKGDGTFGPRRSLSYEGHGLYEVLAADLDRDGNPDMIWNDIRRRSLYLLYGDGKGGFSRTRLLPAGAGVRHAAAADLNGDGWPDLASANTAAGEISVMLSDGKGDFLPTQSFAAGELPRTLAAADLNADGRPDLVVTNMKSDEVTVFLNHGPAPLRLATRATERTAQDPSGTVTTVAGAPEAEAGAPARAPGAALPEGEAPALPDASLELEWEHEFRSGSDANAAYAVSIDENGGVYVAGDVGSGADWRVLHLGPDGEEVWSFDFDGGAVDVPFALTLTPDGQVVAAGAVLGGDDPRALVISLSREGEENWRYEDAEGRPVLHAIASDEDGNLYAAGESDGRWRAISLSPAGELRWSYRGEEGTARSVDVDRRGRVLVAGDDRGIRRVIQLDRDGKVRWERSEAAEHPLGDRAHAIRAGPAGGAVVSGSRRLVGMHARIEMLDGTGQRRWEYLDSHSPGHSVALALDVDAEGSAVAAGESASDWLLLGLDAEGRLLWRFTYDGGGEALNPDKAHAVAFHPEGGFVVVGAIHPVPSRPPTLGDVYWRVARYRVRAGGGGGRL